MRVVSRAPWRGRSSRAGARVVARLLCVLLAAPTTLALHARIAGAQVSPPPSSAALGEAKKFFEAGMKLYKQQLYQEALAQFIESNRIVPREGTQRNIGQTYRDLKDNAAAYRAYEALLANWGDKMKPQLKSDTQQALQELKVLTGTIAVAVPEPGAKVTVDGADVGQTPLAAPVRLNLGTHAVVVTKEGFEPLVQQVDLAPGRNEARVDAPLARQILTGHVNVTATPADAASTAKVLVDGKEVGAPPWEGDLDPGQHTIQLRGASMSSETRPIDVARKGSYDVALTLRATSGTLAVNPSVPDAEISVDGKVVARGSFEDALGVGKHELTVTRAGYATYRKQLLVVDGEKLVENVAMQPSDVLGSVAPHDWTGIYTQFTFIGLFEAGKPTNDVARGVGYTADTKLTGSQTYGGGIDLTVGYSFGFVGVEGSVSFGYDHSKTAAAVTSAQDSVQHPAVASSALPYTELYDFHRVGGDITVGARLMPKTLGIRPTLGVGFGVAVKSILFNRGGVSDNTVTSSFKTYAAPAMKLDGGIELGTTPGSRLYVGVLLMADFAGSIAASGVPATPSGDVFPSPHIDVVHGTDVFLGPILGLQFGE